MKYFIDGDQVAVTRDDFVDLQSSFAVFIPRNSEIGRTIEEKGILWLPIGDLVALKEALDSGREEGKEGRTWKDT